MAKVFSIGLSRTGNRSLTAALKILGYKANHYPIGMVGVRKGKLYFKYDRIKKYDALVDMPIVCFYKEIARRYPAAKFILTTRDKEKWLKSMEKHLDAIRPFKLYKPARLMDKLTYGTHDFDRKKLLKAYDRHVNDVKEHFKGTGRLLVIDIPRGDGWKPLCRFLEKPVPDMPFPHKNKALPAIARKIGSYFPVPD